MSAAALGPERPRWYKDAVVYVVSVKAFYDSNGDGIGDFPGLTQKLDYVQDLGVTCLWLLPFYPSPLRDDGYDVADHTAVHPIYGSLDDFKTFLGEAHARGIRVLTELVIDRTSDQHAWFQRARRSAAGSTARDFYVWSDTDARHADAGVPASGGGSSNWTFDPVARQFYRHRVAAYAPDLNHDNPVVLDAVVADARFWLATGVDGLVLAGAPLRTTPGTAGEGPPAAYEIVKRIRQELAGRNPAAVLVAAPGGGPAAARAYFAGGDGCHVCLHRSLAPRLFLGVRTEDSRGIIDLLNESRALPDVCQWGLFLRNHDELALDGLSEAERDYMHAMYAPDPQMRVHGGIRRRLATLLENSRSRIELLTGILLSLPGTPVLYYGDEIGMGDNVYLGDRFGLRTPMQWSSDRNGGFSRTDPVRLHLPVILDPVYGYEAANVEAQERTPSSLLWSTKRIIALRRQYPVFSRGDLKVIPSTNRKVLAYIRADDDVKVVCVANLSRSTTVVQLDFREFAGERFPRELFGRSELPPIGEDFYSLTLGPHAFYWLELAPLPAGDPRRAQFYSCFISYSTGDQEFADRLYRDLRDHGVRCWFAPHDVHGGSKLHHQIDEAIRSHERVLLILSRKSMASEWVKTEIAKARQLEVREKRQVLFPVRLVPFDAIQQWECFDADTGKDSAREIRRYFIPDFSAWHDDQRYREAFGKLLDGLRSTRRRR